MKEKIGINNTNSNINNTNSNINNTNSNTKSSIKKIVFWEMFCIFGVLAIGLLLIIGRLFYVQVISHDAYVKRAERQQQSKEIIIPQRGNIYDRNGVLLASSIKYISIAIDPTIIRTRKEGTLCNTLDSVAVLLEKYKSISKSSTIQKIKQIQKENNKRKKI